MKTRSVLILSLLITWIIFSGYLEMFFVICGILSCVFAVFITEKMDISKKQTTPLYARVNFYLYIPWLFKEIILSAVNVAKIVWGIKPISPVIAWVPASQQNETGVALYANSITATPGTVCINIENNMLQVHAVSSDGIDNLMAGKMDKKVSRVTE